MFDSELRGTLPKGEVEEVSTRKKISKNSKLIKKESYQVDPEPALSRESVGYERLQ